LIFAIWGSLLFAQKTDAFLPIPTGEFKVGTSKLYLTDSSRKDPFKKSHLRRVYVKIWYPAENNDNATAERYLQDYPLDEIYKAFKIKKLPKDWIEELQSYSTHSFPDIPISEHQKQYPVLIFNPGFYFGLPDLYTSLMEGLASHGYIVCSVNHPYEQPYINFNGEELFIKRKRAQWAYLQLVVADMFQWKPKNSEEHIEEITHYYHKKLRRFNKTVRLWTVDSQFVIDFFTEQQGAAPNSIIAKMDLNRIGAFGQSLGGSVSGELCVQDERIKAGVNLDCFQFGDAVFQPIQQAFMLIQSEYNKSWNLGNTINYKHISGDFAFLNFPGASHFIFSDAAIMPYHSNEMRKSMVGEVCGEDVLSNVQVYILDFFDFYLKKTGPNYIHSNRQQSHLEFIFRKGNQYERASSRALND
jgi:hypothetical protein